MFSGKLQDEVLLDDKAEVKSNIFKTYTIINIIFINRKTL